MNPLAKPAPGLPDMLEDLGADTPSPRFKRTIRAHKVTGPDVLAWALGHGWRLLRNHPTMEQGDRTLRLVINDRSVRLESKVAHSDGTHSWVRIRSGYFKDLKIVDGKLEGLTR